MNGVDISNYQRGLTIRQIKAAGNAFAIIKATEGAWLKDGAAFDFYREAYEMEFPVGCYCYSHATTPEDAWSEAHFLLDTIKGFPMPCGVFLDVEEPKQLGLTKEKLMAIVTVWCKEICEAGYIPGVYSSEYSAWSKLNPNELQDGCLVWVAHYGKQPEIPCDLWQSSDTGRIDGFGENVDTDSVRSDRFKTLVETGGHEITYHKRQLAGDPEQEPPAEHPVSDACPIAKPDPIIMSLQMIMAYAGYWLHEADGMASPDFFEAARTLLSDLEKR